MPADPVIYEPIGVVHTPYKEKKKTPIQGIFTSDSRGTVEVFPRYTEGLIDLDGFSHLILLYHFHMADGCSLTTRPFLDNRERGIFSIRHYNRPNPIGISIVRLEKIESNILSINQVDILDGTPLLDIKPYMPEFDIRKNARAGWYEHAGNIEEYVEQKGVQPENRC